MPKTDICENAVRVIMEENRDNKCHMEAKLPSITGKSSADSRVNMAVPNLLSATVFSRRIKELEIEHEGEEFGEFWHDIFANSSGAIFTSVAALESYANELFVDYDSVFPELRQNIMAKLWELYEQKPTLEKYEFALLLKDGSAFNKGASPYQDVALIIKLRNALVHFKPEWFSQQEEHAKVSKHLKNKAIMSPFFHSSEPLFPRGWASHATVKWVIESTLTFILEFEHRAKVEQRMAKFQERFKKL